jgi:2-amino-4-hydroxy-6-hydroxymethyldihydropteridine diphosphokinase
MTCGAPEEAPEPPAGWLDWYEEILASFGFSRDMDERAARLLASFMGGRPCLKGVMGRMLRGASRVVVAGAYDSVRREAEALKNLSPSGTLLVSADTATSPILDAGLTPDIVVTDLDGDLEDIFEAWRRGAILVIHAHGDNIERIEELPKTLSERVEATCQCPPSGHIHNLGGFTDGDRAVAICAALGAAKIVTIGMCPGCGIGVYSSLLKQTEGWASRKLLKLEYASRLLSWVTTLYPRTVFIDATEAPGKIRGFRKMPLAEALKV